MRVDECFIDTNILVYAHDASAGARHVKARTLLREYWDAPHPPVLSVQVLQECYVTLARKNIGLARDIVMTYTSWRVVGNDLDVFREGMTIQDSFGLSLWDAMVIAAAHSAGCRYVISEDFTHRRLYGQVRVVNPFRSS